MRHSLSPRLGSSDFVRQDTFTSTGNGVSVSLPTPVQSFTISVKATGAVTSWTALLEGSIDNTNFTTILTHTNVTGDGVALFSGGTLSPSLYVRSRVSELSLGSGTNIVVTIIGQ